MKIGLIPVNIGASNGQAMVGMAQLAESLGFESVWTFEHAIVPVDYESKYPYSPNGKMGADPDTSFVDPLIALAAVASQTKTIRLGTGVNILPQANPLYVAKQAASLDFVSNGRFELGVGIGWLREEFRAAGTPFERRGARFDDYIQAMRKIWSGDVVEHKSEFLDWTGFKSKPTPVQDPFPVVIGGTKGKAFERTARYGNGWFAPTGSPDQLAPLMKELDKACTDAGRDRSEIEVTAMWFPNPEDLSDVERYAEMGVGRLVTPLPAILKGNPVESLKAFSENVISKIG
ncbi:MAG: LLM class F420-dependent oxidoreductase [bacterium]|nr:LLM class F420-dependent oxidoreductase [bacterium]MCP5070239.1 LLM class F420-dependent oxidoreductase [bacterium]